MGLFHFDRRPLLLMGIGACCGIYAATGESWVYPILILAAIAALGLAAGTSVRLVLWFAAVSLLFALWGFIAGESMDSSYSRFEGEKCSMVGRVVSVDAQKDRYTLVTVRPTGFLQRKVKVYLFDNRMDFIQGDAIFLEGRLQKPEGSTNPGGYDARKLYYGDGITAMLLCSEGDVYLIEGFSLGHVFGLLRRDIQDKCREYLGEENGDLVSAMLIGDKTRLEQDTLDAFRDSGLSHTMAVSGSHVAYILVPLYFIFSRIGIDKRKYYPWLIVLLIFFAMLAGMQPSVIRAGLTAAILLVGGILDRNPEPLNSLAASALIILLFNPFSLYDAGFILSYTSVLSIMILYKPIVSILGTNPVARIVSMSLAVQLGLLPVTAKLFYSIQVFSIFANILVFPVRAVLAVLGWIMYILSGLHTAFGSLLGGPVGILAGIMSSTAGLFSDSSLSVVNVPYIHPVVIGLYYSGLWFLLKERKKGMLYPVVCTVLITLYFLFAAIPSNTWVFLDSGKADCIIVKTCTGRDILIDAGEYMQGNSLAHFTGDYIDCIFISHAHEDHMGGLFDILDRFRVGAVYVPGCSGANIKAVIDMCLEKGIPCISLLAGDVLEIDGCTLEIMNPADYEYLSLNDTSMVIKLTQTDRTILLCGDSEIASELDMLARGCDLKADVLKVPHHGAVNAAEQDFIDAVDAGIAIITCGADDYNHPSAKTLARLAGCDIYRSDLNGAIIIKLTKNGYRVDTEKQ